jgi:hypothetical protein
MTATVSKVLYSDKETNALLREVCRRTFEAGGSFTIETAYKENWFVTYTITPPESVKCKT